jgi:hypothetical protein
LSFVKLKVQQISARTSDIQFITFGVLKRWNADLLAFLNDIPDNHNCNIKSVSSKVSHDTTQILLPFNYLINHNTYKGYLTSNDVFIQTQDVPDLRLIPK